MSRHKTHIYSILYAAGFACFLELDESVAGEPSADGKSGGTLPARWVVDSLHVMFICLSLVDFIHSVLPFVLTEWLTYSLAEDKRTLPWTVQQRTAEAVVEGRK